MKVYILMPRSYLSCLIKSSSDVCRTPEKKTANLICPKPKVHRNSQRVITFHFFFFSALANSFVSKLVLRSTAQPYAFRGRRKEYARQGKKISNPNSELINDLHIRHLHYILISVPTLTVSFFLRRRFF